MISSTDNAKIKAVAKLVPSAKARRDSGMFVLEGTRLSAEALGDNIRICEMYYTNNVAASNPTLISNLRARANFETEVSESVFEKISDTCSPQGVLLVVQFKAPVSVPDNGRFLAFEMVQDPSNLGAAARRAEVVGGAGVVLGGRGAVTKSPKSLRASMGALLRLPIIYSDDFLATLECFKSKGFNINGTVVDANATKINTVSFSQNEVTVIGNEANGMTDAAKSVCDRLLTIPMAGRAESLNAAAAAAIVMWEMCR